MLLAIFSRKGEDIYIYVCIHSSSYANITKTVIFFGAPKVLHFMEVATRKCYSYLVILISYSHIRNYIYIYLRKPRVNSFLWNILLDVPMLSDLSIFNSVDINTHLRLITRKATNLTPYPNFRIHRYSL